MTRRKFMTISALTAGALIVKPQIIRGSQANSAIRIGLLGCGHRGTAVAQAFVNNSKNNCRIVAIADLFDDQLQNAKKLWDDVAGKNGYLGIDPKLIFKGPDAFEQIANCKQLDMIILSTPDYFHPQHLQAIVNAGKHCYCEKPAAVDVEGCRKFIEIGEQALGKLSLDVGFIVRNAPCFSEVVGRIHKGDIGKVSFGSLHYHASTITYPDFPNASPLELRIRRFYWDKVLSGDTILDQDIHVIDMANWVMGAHPEKAIGYGGRKVRQDTGDIWDNWSLSFKYPGDVNINFSAVQFADFWDVGVRFIGDQGIAESNYSGFGCITGKQAWSTVSSVKEGGAFSTAGSFDGLGDASGIKARLFVESIISGNYHNQALEGAESALSAILGRMAAYGGEEVTWSEMMGSNQSYQGLIDLTKL
jgi:myo-inositol 2-dehydrogenase / D-chiro-inositol 1-dehydrogenase